MKEEGPPPRPLHPYFKFRNQVIRELKEEGVVGPHPPIVKEKWDHLEREQKTRMQQEFEEELKVYKQSLDQWKANHPGQGKIRRRSKSKEREIKPVRTKGKSKVEKMEIKTEGQMDGKKVISFHIWGEMTIS